MLAEGSSDSPDTPPKRVSVLYGGHSKKPPHSCRCGFLGDPRRECRCTPLEVERYRSRISGPLLDRVDLHVEVPRLTLDELHHESAEPTTAVAARVAAAREVQRLRFGRRGSALWNAAMTERQLARHCHLEPAAQSLLDTAFERLGLSIRAVTRVLKVARTIADLASNDEDTEAAQPPSRSSARWLASVVSSRRRV